MNSIIKTARAYARLLLLCVCPAIFLEMRRRMWKRELCLRKDLKSAVKVPFLRRLWAWKHGYTGKCIKLYHLTSDNMSLYLPDLTYQWAHPINGRFSSLIDNKLSLTFALGAFREHLPEYYFFLRHNETVSLQNGGRSFPREDTDVILDLGRVKGRLALKRLSDTFGAGFCSMSFDAQGFRWNGKPISVEALSRTVLELQDYLVTEFVEQHEYARSLYPNTTNTLRIMTARDYAGRESFVMRVLQKIGSSRSVSAADHVALGGMACDVNLDSGELGPAVSFVEDTLEPIWFERHPDTGTQIAGACVPNWRDIRAKILLMAERLSVIPYMGWDVVVTQQGFKVLEINSLPGVNLVQFFKPLLDDPRTRSFYETHIPSLRRAGRRP